ncbi:proline-rich receptor-like protein kinase PERK2 [Iris pallida]|uniref:Proline-rich receptor-like protein kinase PERK2 n=1 Tax=Iris pallida TaxID=29817 RepID=A0AAX6EI08_IRIPA|nr:proline-rich receptor-like protein kinase PERK2 [Iris pallida]
MEGGDGRGWSPPETGRPDLVGRRAWALIRSEEAVVGRSPVDQGHGIAAVVSMEARRGSTSGSEKAHGRTQLRSDDGGVRSTSGEW